MGVIIECGVETYRAGKAAQAFASPPLVGGYKFMYVLQISFIPRQDGQKVTESM